MHPYSFRAITDAQDFTSGARYHRYEETSYRPLIQNVWLQQLFKRWYKEEKENIVRLV